MDVWRMVCDVWRGRTRACAPASPEHGLVAAVLTFSGRDLKPMITGSLLQHVSAAPGLIQAEPKNAAAKTYT
eukprot:2757159-Lingulodinium_polyedra.AAC.1